MGEHVEVVRAFLLSEAEQPLNVLRMRLAAARADFRATLENVTDEQTKFAPPGGEGEEAWLVSRTGAQPNNSRIAAARSSRGHARD